MPHSLHVRRIELVRFPNSLAGDGSTIRYYTVTGKLSQFSFFLSFWTEIHICCVFLSIPNLTLGSSSKMFTE